MSGQPRFVSPFHRPRCLAAAAPAGKAKLTHPGKAILAGKKVCEQLLRWLTCTQRGGCSTCLQVSALNLFVHMCAEASAAALHIYTL